MAKRNRPEDEIQKVVVDNLQQRGVPGLVWWHTPNGMRSGPRQGARFKRLGMRAGVSDIVALHKGKFYALELKAPKGVMSDSQLQFLEDVHMAGGETFVASGLHSALMILEGWGLLRGRAV